MVEYIFPEISLVRYLLSAPTFLEIDISLSLRMIKRLASVSPAWLSASKDIPPVSAPSPITAIEVSDLLFSLFANATPNAALIEVDEWPAPKTSCSLSLLFVKPDRPSF